MKHTQDERDQIEDCKQLRNEGATWKYCLSQGYAYACVAIAFGRDPENMTPYGAQNGAVK